MKRSSGVVVADCGELLPYQIGKAVHVYTKVNTRRDNTPILILIVHGCKNDLTVIIKGRRKSE